MIEKVYIVQNSLGLHARPAAQLVQTTNRFRSKIRFIKEDLEVDGKSIMGLLMLAAPKGSTIKALIEGEDEKEMAEALFNLFSGKFGEE
jgi:phosphocarrier protein HPr